MKLVGSFEKSAILNVGDNLPLNNNGNPFSDNQSIQHLWQCFFNSSCRNYQSVNLHCFFIASIELPAVASVSFDW